MSDNVSLYGHLQEIGTSLWDRGGAPGSGRAAIMVGAGFSRNARRMASIAPKFPDWEDVAKALVDRLYPPCQSGFCGRDAVHKEDCETCRRRRRQMASARETSGALRLAEIYEGVHGRAALERVLAATIPSSQYQPGLLHQKLVRLPWSDIFTTNWDDLLEKSVDLYDRSYSFIHVPKHIATRPSPRIVNLHGSLKAGTPLIFTENDFLNYPTDFAPFVSLVQQSMVENVFVLVGFSGEDPNFLHWLGWVRRQLGNFVQQIYLVGTKEVDDPERRLLSSRGVIPLDITPLASDDGDTPYEKALLGFFNCLERIRGIVRCNTKWPARTDPSTKPVRPAASVHPPQIRGKLEDWSNRLVDMPQWLSLPQKNRSSALSYLSPDGDLGQIIQALILDPAQIPAPTKSALSAADREHYKENPAEFLRDRAEAVRIATDFRYFARVRTDKDLANAYVVFILDACGSTLIGATPVDRFLNLFKGTTPKEVREAQRRFFSAVAPSTRDSVLLALYALLRYARYSAHEELFVCLIGLLSLQAQADAKARGIVLYEETLHHLDHSRTLLAQKTIRQLEEHDFQPRWGLRRAALLAEIFREDDARELLDDTVTEVRRLRFEPDKPTRALWQKSREAWAYFAYFNLGPEPRHPRDRFDTNAPQLKPEEILDELDNRLSELAGSSSDPRFELHLLTSDLMEAAYRTALSDAGGGTLPPNTNPVVDPVDIAFAYLLLMEAVGLPPRLAFPSDDKSLTPVAVTVASILWHSDPPLALSLLLRSAVPGDLVQPPLPIDRRVAGMSESDASTMLADLIARANGLASNLVEPQGLADYIDGRLATVFALMRTIVACKPACAAPAFAAACNWHSRTSLADAPEALQEYRYLFEAILKAPGFAWADHLPVLFRLDRPMRTGEVWGREDWPDPFAVLAGPAPGVQDQFTLSTLGENVVANHAADILEASHDDDAAIAATSQMMLGTTDGIPVRRRLHLIAKAREALATPG
jgi:hypothetical protein